jgi:hypothetical protein
LYLLWIGSPLRPSMKDRQIFRPRCVCRFSFKKFIMF